LTNLTTKGIRILRHLSITQECRQKAIRKLNNSFKKKEKSSQSYFFSFQHSIGNEVRRKTNKTSAIFVDLTFFFLTSSLFLWNSCKRICVKLRQPLKRNFQFFDKLERVKTCFLNSCAKKLNIFFYFSFLYFFPNSTIWSTSCKRIKLDYYYLFLFERINWKFHTIRELLVQRTYLYVHEREEIVVCNNRTVDCA
jgi:hypothetical protein